MESDFFREEVEIQKLEVKARDETIEKINQKQEIYIQEIQEYKLDQIAKSQEIRELNLKLNTYVSREDDLKDRWIVSFNYYFNKIFIP